LAVNHQIVVKPRTIIWLDTKNRPPAQNRTRTTNAYGSYIESKGETLAYIASLHP